MTLSEEMTKRAYALTGMEDPNSVSQLKGWLEERGIEIDSLGKKNVAALITDLDKHSIDTEALDMMKLRLQMTKSSVKNIRLRRGVFVRTEGRTGCFSFMVRIVQDIFPEDLCNCRICRKTTSLRLMKPVNL